MLDIAIGFDTGYFSWECGDPLSRFRRCSAQAIWESYSSQLQSIGSSLTDSGDLLLYGCNVAQGDAGKLFIDSLAAAMSQADVAASNDLTGGSGDLIQSFQRRH
ncbi:MAG: DUF4347 domain-containing protein [Candidatus Accumulibacter sp.]|nr:DUF4347 domain-containing protein [Accumulibacter sp.]